MKKAFISLFTGDCINEGKTCKVCVGLESQENLAAFCFVKSFLFKHCKVLPPHIFLCGKP